MAPQSANVLTCFEPETMPSEEFNSIMEKGLSQAKSDQSRPLADVFADLKQMDTE